MRAVLIVTYWFINTIFVYSQNLVLNPSFEQYDSCPKLIGDFDPPFLKSWTNPTLSSPDFYNVCSSGNPNPSFTGGYGPQGPRNGNGLAGIITYSQSYDPTYDPNNTKEFMEGILSNTLTKDSIYCVKFYLSLSEFLRQPMAQIGVYFSNTQISLNGFQMPFVPQIQSSATQFFDDEKGWQLWQQTYKAKGGERYFIIGNFNPIAITPVKPPAVKYGDARDSSSYYFVDDVSIELLPSSIATTGLGADSLLCDTLGFSRLLSVQPIYDSVRWSTGASISSILINRIGEYSVRCYYGECAVLDTIRFSYFATTASLAIADTTSCQKNAPLRIPAPLGFDSYRWSSGDTGRIARIVQSGIYYLSATNYCGSVLDTFSVVLYPTPLPPLVTDTSLCQGSPPFEAQAAGQVLRWYDRATDTLALVVTPTIATDQAGSRTFFSTQTVNNCESEKASFTVRIDPLPRVDIGDKQTACIGRTVVIQTAVDSSYQYLWNTGDSLPYIEVAASGSYRCEVSNNCGSVSDMAAVLFVDCAECLYVPNAFSPNGDSKNDLYFTYSVCPIRYFELQIFNRWGEMVFSSQDIAQGWDGNYKNQALPTGVYTYRVLLVNELGKTTTRKGSVTLIR